MSKMLGRSTDKGFNSTDMERVALYDGEITYNTSSISAELEVGRTYIFSVYLDTLTYTHTFVITIADDETSFSTASKFSIVNGTELANGFVYLSYRATSQEIRIHADVPNANTKANAKISYVVLC